VTPRCLRRIDLAMVLLFAGALLMPASVRAQNYTYVNIDYPVGSSEPEAVNDSAKVVGYWQDGSGNIHGYYWDGANFTSLDYPGASATLAEGINNDGVISGEYLINGEAPHGFTYQNGAFTTYDYPGFDGQTDGQGINNHGDLVGFYNLNTPTGFLSSGSSFDSLSYPGAGQTFPHALNDSDQVVGYYRVGCCSSPIGFLYANGTFTSIEYPNSYETYAYGINNAGVVVGYNTTNDGTHVGWLWQNGTFTSILPASANPGPTGINNNGQIVGYYVPGGVVHGFIATPVNSPSKLQFVAATPCRLVDTRNTGGPSSGGTSRSFAVPQLGGCDIPGSAQAYSLNVTVVPHGPLGYLTIWPTGESQPTVSTMNSPDGRVKANAAMVPAGTGGAVSVFVSNTSDVILDINGYFTAPTSSTLEFYPLAPCRVIDTRNADGNLTGPFLKGGVGRDFPVPDSPCLPANSGAAAYSFNVTVVPHPAGEQLGYLTVWPTGESQPTVSTLNNPTATVVANAAIVPAGSSGSVAMVASNDTDVVVDINGYFAAPASGGLSLYAVTPCRVLDTRNVGSGNPISGQYPVNVTGSACAPPSSAQAYVFNATVVPSGSLGYLTLWPNGRDQPTVSTLNAQDGFVTSNMAIVPTQNGSIDAFASNPTQLVLDISSYFAP